MHAFLFHKSKHKLSSVSYEANVKPRYKAPRHPLIFCHGLFGFDKMGPDSLPSLQIHYWPGVEKALLDLGATVYIAKVPP